MRSSHFALAISTLCCTASSVAAATTIDSVRWQRRVLLVSAPDSKDPKIALEHRIFAEWKREASDPDVSLITVVGTQVDGASDSATALKSHHKLDTRSFQ